MYQKTNTQTRRYTGRTRLITLQTRIIKKIGPPGTSRERFSPGSTRALTCELTHTPTYRARTYETHTSISRTERGRQTATSEEQGETCSGDRARAQKGREHVRKDRSITITRRPKRLRLHPLTPHPSTPPTGQFIDHKFLLDSFCCCPPGVEKHE